MRIEVVGLFLVCLAGCANMAKSDAARVADEFAGVWIGLGDAGELWWRLRLDEGGRGKAAIARGGAVATYRITAWTAAENGKTSVHLQRSGSVAAVDKFPASIPLTGAGDGSRLRLAHGKSEIVFWREDRLIRQRNLLRSRMK
jgi:hypothetical protein